MNDNVRRLARKITDTDGIHHANTLSPAKLRVLHAVHESVEPCNEAELAEVLGWGRPYVYRMASELADQGILVRLPAVPKLARGRPPVRYRCICTTTEEGLHE